MTDLSEPSLFFASRAALSDRPAHGAGAVAILARSGQDVARGTLNTHAIVMLAGRVAWPSLGRQTATA